MVVVILWMVAGGTAGQAEKSSKWSAAASLGNGKAEASVAEAKGFACEKKLSSCWASTSLSNEGPAPSRSCEAPPKKSAEKVSG